MSEKLIKYTRKECLGVVGVDSGILMVMDQCYTSIASELTDNALHCYFWGRNRSEVAEFLANSGFKVEDGCANANVIHNISLDDKVRIKDIIDTHPDWFVITNFTEDDFSNRSFNVTCGRNQGGSIPFPLGHDGLAVCFSSGFGDGVYEVWAHYAIFEEFDERIAKVEIILIDDRFYDKE